MSRALLMTLLAAGLASVSVPAQADHWGSYPKVRTFSGGYYGPTQAHYQYFRRYGRPWHGQGGFSGGVGVGYVNGYPGYGVAIGGWGCPWHSCYGYGSLFGSSAFYHSGGFYNGVGAYPPVIYPPVVSGSLGFPSPWSGFSQPIPYVPGFDLTPVPPGFSNPVLSDAWDDNLKQWEQPLELQPEIATGKPALPASTPAAKQRSIQLQDQGDRRLRENEYLQAISRYRDAISAAPDRAEPHLHLAFALASIKQFDEAVKELKVGLALEPGWASSGQTLDMILGPENFITKTQLKQRIAEWTLRDVRDPDRLFLLGTMLYLDNDPERGQYILETAARFGGLREHLAVFLRQDRGAVAVGQPDPAAIGEPEQSPDDVGPPKDVPALPPLPDPPPTDDVPPPAPQTSEPKIDVPRPQLSGPAFPR